MAYQNNNNRIVPNAVEDRNLKPAATPTDKMIKYNPNMGTENAVMWKNTGTALASIGKGLVDMDNIWLQQAAENAIRAQALTEAEGGNKKDWAEVSKRVKGAAIFNPYNDDAYRSIQAKDIATAAYLDFATTPDIEKLDPEKYAQLQQTTSQKMIEAYKQSGLSPKDYGHALVNYKANTDKLYEAYTQKHAVYIDQRLATKMASDLSFNSGLNVYNSEDKVTALKVQIQESINQMTELGKSTDWQTSVIYAGMKGFLAKNGDAISLAEFQAATSDLEINGEKLSEVIPDYEYKLKQLHKDAQQAIYNDKEFAYQSHQLDLKIAAQGAMKDMYEWTTQNPNASYQSILAKSQAVISQYGLEEEGFSFLNEMSRDQKTFMEFQEVKTNPDVAQTLASKMFLGTLTEDDINEAVLNREINYKDGFSLYDRLNREAKAQTTAVTQNFNELDRKLKKNGYYGQNLGVNSEDTKEIQRQANTLINDFKEGKASAEEVNVGLQNLNRIAAAKIQLKNVKATNDSFLLNKNYIRSQKAPSYNAKTAIDAFNKLAIERGKLGQKINADITSAPNDNRVINGKASPHKGYDLAATNKTHVHNINMRGVCVAAGYDSGFGNYVVIKYDNGTYMRLGHLSTSTTYLQKRIIPAGMVLGYAGSTGFSTGVHVHADFWNKDRQLISVEQFARGIR